jgi:hypothetical protein
MKKLKIISLLIVTCMLVTLIPTAITAESTHSTVTGVISLPEGEKAPSGGVKITLVIGTDNLTPSNNKDDVSISQEIIIPKGQNSISYSIMVPKSSNAKAKYSVFYTAEGNYAPFGWYSDKGTTAIKNNRSQIDINAGNVKNVNIELLKGKSISGKIILGNKKTTLTDDMTYKVTAIQKGSDNNSSDDDIIITKEVTIPSGKNEAGYELIVPLNTSGKGYIVYYTYKNNGYTEAGYYNINGTSRSESRVTLIDVSNTVTGINLVTLPFTVISGRLYLPEGDRAPNSGVEAIITAQNPGKSTAASDDFSIMKNFTIKKGESYVNYSLSVPVSETDYVLSYTVSKDTGYITQGYYHEDGTVQSRSRAKGIKAGEEPVKNINLRILKKGAPTATPTPTPTPKPSDDKYDLNGDGHVNVFDLLELAQEIVNRYKKEGFDKDLEQYKGKKLDKKDLDIIRDVFRPFTNNKYKVKWFNSLNQLFDFDIDWDWEDFQYLKKQTGSSLKDLDWEKYWEYWKTCRDTKPGQEKNNGNKNGWLKKGKK